MRYDKFQYFLRTFNVDLRFVLRILYTENYQLYNIDILLTYRLTFDCCLRVILSENLV